MGTSKAVSVLDYNGTYPVKIDDKNRLKLPPSIRETMRERNKYHFQSDEFTIERHGGLYLVAFRNIPFATIESDSRVTKETFDMETIDGLVYVAAGTIRWDTNIKPVFMFPNPDTVFLYAATDAQHLTHDDVWKELGFASRHHQGTIDKQGRIQLAHTLEDLDYIMRTVADRERQTHVIGQPSMFCATLTRYG